MATIIIAVVAIAAAAALQGHLQPMVIDLQPGARYGVAPHQNYPQHIVHPEAFGLNPKPWRPTSRRYSSGPGPIWRREGADAVLYSCFDVNHCTFKARVKDRFYPDDCATYIDAKETLLWPIPRVWSEEAHCHNPSPCEPGAYPERLAAFQSRVCISYQQGGSFSG